MTLQKLKTSASNRRNKRSADCVAGKECDLGADSGPVTLLLLVREKGPLSFASASFCFRSSPCNISNRI